MVRPYLCRNAALGRPDGHPGTVFVGIAVSLPLGILLALRTPVEHAGHKNALHGLHRGHRGVPLITVLFMASVMLPLFLPQGVTFDKFLRALIGVSLFASAYMAEVVRGGLQGHPERPV
ncbi:ABC transporter permease subunit (plasmid) [Sinorhizobium meliloti]|nr:ABC transporter permease subunit [Sinorhizobium meliloti]WRQ72114.1 ABC transporter permease subunit [Sinorhizobium meliloti]